MTEPEEYYAKQPEFLGPTVVEIAVPSGRLIAADSLCNVDRFDVEMPLSIESGAGLDAFAKAFAEVGVAYAFVGNTSPTVTRRTDGLIQVISPCWDAPKEIGDVVGDETVVANICTDIWATMLTDYRGWLDHGGPDVDTANAPLLAREVQRHRPHSRQVPLDRPLPLRPLGPGRGRTDHLRAAGACGGALGPIAAAFRDHFDLRMIRYVEKIPPAKSETPIGGSFDAN